MEAAMELISEYGVPLVISGIFIFLALEIINFAMKYLHKKYDINGEEARKEEAELLAKRAEVDLKIQYIIDKALNDTDGERISVMEFHNHQANMASLPCRFMSCTYETYRVGLLPVAFLLNQISTSLYSIVVTNMQKSPYIILDTEKRDPDLARIGYELVEAKGVSKSLCVVMRSLRNTVLGYVSLGKNTEFTQNDITTMIQVGAHVASLLGSAEEVKKG
jgi:hypothetical protein